MRTIFVPPGGFMGFAGQTMAAKALVTKKKRPATRRKKRVTRKKPVRARRRPATRRKVSRKKPARLVKGSAAAKRHMAKLRKMRRR